MPDTEVNPYPLMLEWYETHGWIQHQMYDVPEWTPYAITAGCISGCFRQVMIQLYGCDWQGPKEGRQEWEELNQWAGELFPDRKSSAVTMSSVVCVNDDLSTTFDDIRTLIEKAAIRWEEEHG